MTSASDYTATDDIDHERTVTHNRLLFLIGAAAIVTGLVFPCWAYPLDVLLVLALSLTGVIVGVSFSTRHRCELRDLPWLAVLTSATVLFVAIASTKLVMLERHAGMVISFAAKLNVIGKLATHLQGVLVFVFVASIVFVTTCKKIGNISRSIRKFIKDCLSADELPCEAASERPWAGKMSKEVALLLRVCAAGRFVLTVSAITLFVTCVELFSALLASRVGTVAAAPKTYTALASAPGVMSQILMLAVTFALARSVKKDLAESVESTRISQQQFHGRIKVIARDVAADQQLRVGNAAVEMADYRDEASQVPIEADDPDDNIEYMEAQFEDGQAQEVVFSYGQFNDEACFDVVAQVIQDEPVRKMILVAAEQIRHLPVTIPVNIAMRLAKAQRKTLLVDFDLKRAAVAKVFDVDSSSCLQMQTCIDNLRVLPGATVVTKSNIAEQLSGQGSNYDCVLLYVPEIASVPSGLFDVAEAAILFGGCEFAFESLLNDLRILLTNQNCRLIKPADVLTPA